MSEIAEAKLRRLRKWVAVEDGYAEKSEFKRGWAACAEQVHACINANPYEGPLAEPRPVLNEALQRVIDAMVATKLDVSTWERETLEELARAAILGLRVPTRPMIDALQDYAVCAGYIEEGWAAAIDAALK